MRDDILAPLACENVRSFRLSCDPAAQTDDFSALIRLADFTGVVRDAAVHLIFRTIPPPMTIMIEPLSGLISCRGRKGPCLADQTKDNPIAGTERTKANVMAATISLPLTAIATIQPMDSDKRRCPTKSPYIIKRIRACACDQV
jgi:hypothetical protein